MYNSIFYDFLKINRKITITRLGWSVICLLFLTLTSLSFAQQHVVVPNSLENIDGPTRWNFFNNGNQVIQLLINESQLTNLVGQEISGISFRLPGANSDGPATEPWPLSPFTYGNFNIYLSESVPIANYSTTFANNVVGTQTQVRSGELTIDQNDYQIGNPAPFGPTIAFDTPYSYTGGNLLLEVRHDGGNYPINFNTVNGISATHPDFGTNVRAITSIGNSFDATSGSSGSFNMPIVRFTSEPPPTCPNVATLSTNNITFTSVDVSWTAGGSETLWNIQWGTEDFNPNTNTGTADGNQNGLTSLNYTITNLTPETNYKVYVQADCGSGDTSTWILTYFRTGYCIPNGLNSSSSYYISSATTDGTLGNLNYTATSGVGYVDETSTIITTYPGNVFTFTITQSTSTGYFYIWADWNNNISFNDPGETILATTAFGSSGTATITIPANLQLGNYRLRIANSWSGSINSACGPANYGNFIDFTLNVVDLPSCMPPSSLSFTQDSLTSGTLGWTGSSNLFDLEWGEAGFALGSGTQINGLTTNSFPVAIVTETNYQFYVRQDCGGGDVSVWQGPFNFKTGYCRPSTTCSNGAKITNFEINNAIINLANNTGTATCGAQGYNNFTSLSATASEGIQLSTVVGVGSYSGGVKIWIDWNQNGVLDTDEIVAQSTTIITAGNTFTGTFTVPAGTLIGDYRLRVRVVESTTNFTACSSHSYGETEDYTFKVIAPQTCMHVSIPITATNSSATSVLLQWTSDGNLFDIEYGTQGFVQGSGTMLTEVSNPYTLTGLTAGTQYDFYVRQNCGNGDESIWQGPISFTSGNFDGKISSMLDTEPEVTSLACGSTFNIDVPAGKQIESLKVEYTMTSASPRFISDQRSVLYSPTLNVGETLVVNGNQNDNFPGFENYSRFVDFANGATGTVVFELKAWRVAGNAGCTDNEIFVEEGTWILTPTFEDIPVCPNPPTDLGYNVISESSVELFWTEGEANATHQLKYGNVGFNVNSAGTTENNLTTNSVTLTGLDPFVAQEFYVRRDCGAGDFSTWVGPFKFNSGYCIPTSDITYHFTAFSTTNAIQNATYSNSTASGTGYVNNTAMIIEQLAGESFDFSSNYIGGASGLRIWVDWDNDFIFDNSEEVFYLGNNSGNKTGNISIASDKLPGDYRMRVRVEQGASSIPLACGEISMGEAMDFVLRVACPTIAPPIGDENQIFINGQTIADLVVSGTNLVWYSDVALTSTLPTTTELIHNTIYYVVNESGICKSSALAITVTDCANVVSTPTGETNQNFTTGQTIADLIVGGTGLVWYSDIALTSVIPTTITLINGATYYVRSEVGICKSSALAITVTNCANVVSTPTGETNQTFTAGQTIGDLVVNGTNLVFYNSTYTEIFNLTDELVDNQTYYVVSQVGNCQSAPLIIKVTQVVSRSDFDIYGFSYHPNPVNDVLYFSSNSKIENVTINNILGQKIDANLNSDNTILDMSDLPSGNYFVKITIEGASKTIKIIKN